MLKSVMKSQKKNEDRTSIVIEAGKSRERYWRDLVSYRELFYFLAQRDILVRYKQTVIGILWNVIQPLLTMLILTFVFSRIAKLPTDGAAPYALLVFTALLPWQFFSKAMQTSSESIVLNKDLISKIYFPRMIIPLTGITTALFGFVISFSLYLIIMLYYQFWPSWRVLTLPFFLMLAIASAIGIGLLVSALNVTYRDFRYIMPFTVQFGLYVSPVGFSSSIIPEKWRLLYSINPMVGVIDGFRWALLRQDVNFYFPGFCISLLVIGLVLWLGIYTFRKTETTFADRI